MSQSRRLAAILAADVAGYSRLMGVDEEGTHERLKAHLAELVNSKIAEHRGRIVKNTGDGFLAEFASVVDAVRCAVEVQRGMAERNADAPAEERIEFRIGINLGDVIVEEHDIFGDGVNVAARLEALAEQGGICVSMVVRDQVRDRLDYAFEDLGEQQVKNIARPIRIYRVLFQDTAPAPRKAWQPFSEKPSIAVLPFQNMSGDAEQEYFSDGVSSDIITELSRNHSLFIISRNSSFTYRGRSVDVRHVSRELGVRYVVEGSVRRSGDRVRVGAQLVEGETGNHLWAERYDRLLQDVFAVQDEITAAVITAVLPAVMEAEQRRALRKPPENLGAWEAYQRGLWHMSKFSGADGELATQFFERAINLDPTFAAAYSNLALAYTESGAVHALRSVDETIPLTRASASKAVECDPSDADAHAALAFAAMLAGTREGVSEQLALALACNENSTWANGIQGLFLGWSGRGPEARQYLRTALRLNPRDSRNALFTHQIEVSYYFEHDYTNAVEAARRTIATFPGYPLPYRWLAAALGQLGRTQEAREALHRAIAISPQGFDLYVCTRPPWFRPEEHEHLLDGLRKAGWQDEASE